MRSMTTKLALIIWALLLPFMVPSLAHAHNRVWAGRVGTSYLDDSRDRRCLQLGGDAVACVQEEGLFTFWLRE